MTDEQMHGLKIDRLEDAVGKLASTVEHQTERIADLVGELKLLRQQYSQIPKLDAKVESLQETVAAHAVWVKLLGAGLLASIAGVAGALIKLLTGGAA